jgi:hypothetical protein
MIGNAERDERMRAYLQSCRETIARHGGMIQGVFPTAISPGVGFSYTVGLTAAGLPELVISGLPMDLAGTLLNDAARTSLGAEIKAGNTIADIANVSFKVIDAPKAEINLARRLYGADVVRALQLVWPDDSGHYPGDAGWSLAGRQEIFVDEDKR